MGKLHARLDRKLTLYVRQLAWLHATPRPDPGTRRAQQQVKSGEADKRSRLDRMKKSEIAGKLPPNPAPHMTDRLIEIGLSEAAGMGAAPIGWQTIDAWCRRTGIDLPPWEARLLRRLSVAYVAEGRRAESENAPPPWQWPVTADERDAEEKRLRMVLG